MRRNPGNLLREIEIYPDAKSGFVRMEFTKINNKSKKTDRQAPCAELDVPVGDLKNTESA